MQHTFYVTTVEIDNGHEHNYRLPQGEALPEDHRLKAQRPAGEFKLGDLLSGESKSKLLSVKF